MVSRTPDLVKECVEEAMVAVFRYDFVEFLEHTN